MDNVTKINKYDDLNIFTILVLPPAALQGSISHESAPQAPISYESAPQAIIGGDEEDTELSYINFFDDFIELRG